MLNYEIIVDFIKTLTANSFLFVQFVFFFLLMLKYPEEISLSFRTHLLYGLLLDICISMIGTSILSCLQVVFCNSYYQWTWFQKYSAVLCFISVFHQQFASVRNVTFFILLMFSPSFLTSKITLSDDFYSSI